MHGQFSFYLETIYRIYTVNRECTRGRGLRICTVNQGCGGGVEESRAEVLAPAYQRGGGGSGRGMLIKGNICRKRQTNQELQQVHE